MQIAVIREAECVGCAKCLPACPVDAIIGAPQFLHSVFTEECIGCGLCLAPCPMDCIEMIERKVDDPTEKLRRATKAKERYQARQKRLILSAAPKLTSNKDPEYKEKIQKEIQEAINRTAERRKLI